MSGTSPTFYRDGVRVMMTRDSGSGRVQGQLGHTPTPRDWNRNNVNLPIACPHGPNSLQAAWQGGAGLKSIRTTKSKLGCQAKL